MRFAVSSLLLVVLGLGLGGCGDEPARHVSESDLPAIGAVKPPRPEQQPPWEDAEPYAGVAFTPEQVLSGGENDSEVMPQPAWTAWMRALEYDGFKAAYTENWRRDPAFLDVLLFAFRDSSGARDAFSAFAGAKRTDAFVRAENVEAAGLGEMAVGWASTRTGTVFFAWQRANLVTWVSLECPCDFDAVDAARAYADALDREARTT